MYRKWEKERKFWGETKPIIIIKKKIGKGKGTNKSQEMHSCQKKNESMNLGSKAQNGNSCNTHSDNDGQNDKGKLMLLDALQRHDG